MTKAANLGALALFIALLAGAGHSAVLEGPGGPIRSIVCTAGCSQAGQVFTVNAAGGAVTASASYRGSGNQVIATSSTAIVDLATLIWDTDSAVTTGAGWHFTVPAAKGGRYFVRAYFYDSNNHSGATQADKRILLFKNGGLLRRMHDDQWTPNPAVRPPRGFAIVDLAAGDQIDFRAQNTHATLTYTIDRLNSVVSIARLP